MDTVFGMKILYTKDLMNVLGIGRDRAYALMRSSGFPSTKLGRNYFVTDENLQKWLKDYTGKQFML